MDSRRTVVFLILLILALGGMIFYGSIPHIAPLSVPEIPSVVHEVPAPATQASPGTTLSSRVSVTSPKPGASVAAVFSVTGKAPGNWYFEASFPIIVSDADGNKIATSHGQAQGEWMTTELVPFTASIDVGSYKGKATVNLLRDNPSGLPENDDSTSFDVVIQ